VRGLKQFNFQFLEAAFPSSHAMLRFSFETIQTRGNCAHLAVLNRQMAHDVSILREQSAHFQKNDCFECLSPHIKVIECTDVRSVSIAA